jgi:biotin/lipoate A/B protein ligase family protein
VEADALETRLLAPKLQLPPPFTLVTLREVGDAFAHAIEIAPERGAGTLIYVDRFDLAEFAVVLEPDEPLRSARRALYTGMAALVDALLAFAPPEKPITVDWPDAIRIDGGLVGGGRLAWPKNAREDVPPDWLVFSGMIRTVSITGNDPGLHPMASALEEEGFTDVAATQLVESFARHLMVHVDALQEYGFGAVARAYLPRLPAEGGAHRAIDENGDLLIRRGDKTGAQRMALTSMLATPSWLDPKNGGPRT